MVTPAIKCFFCDFTSKQEPNFIRHLQIVHNVRATQDLYDQRVLKADRPTCGCGCGESVLWNGWKHGYARFIRGHNAKVDTCFSDPETIEKMVAKRLEGYKTGRLVAPGKGQTAKNSEKKRQTNIKIGETLREGYATGRITDWRVDNPEKALEVAKKSSETKLRKYASGETKVWTEGQDKFTNEKIAQAAAKISRFYQEHGHHAKISVDELLDRIAKYDNFEFVSSPDEYKHRRVDRLLFRCKKCNVVQPKSLAMLEESPVCYACHPNESKGQLELYEFVKTIVPDAILSTRDVIKPQELDIFVPSKQFAIEFNGNYYHSEACKPSRVARKFHSKKTKDCENLGIRLLHVFDDEWKEKQEIVKSLVKSRLGVAKKGPFARQCQIKQLSRKECNHFFRTFHLDGSAQTHVGWGLLDDKQNLVASLSLRKPGKHFSKDVIELARFATAEGLSVPGALSRLLAIAKQWAKTNGYKKIMTYVDSRYGDGHGYERIGFKFQYETINRQWWVDKDNTRIGRRKYRANKKLGQTQKEVAQRAGVYRIWGCPNKVYEINL